LERIGGIKDRKFGSRLHLQALDVPGMSDEQTAYKTVNDLRVTGRNGGV
jgi:hypothetical protein